MRLDDERSLQKTAGYTDELLACILDVAACIKKRKDQLRRTTRDLSTRVQEICHLNIKLKVK